MLRPCAAVAALLAVLALTGCGPLPGGGNGSEHGAPGIVQPNDRVYLITATATRDRQPAALPVLLDVVANTGSHESGALLEPTFERTVTTPYVYTLAIADDFVEPVYVTANVQRSDAAVGEGIQVSIRRQGYGGPPIAAAGVLQTASHRAKPLGAFINTWCEATV